MRLSPGLTTLLSIISLCFPAVAQNPPGAKDLQSAETKGLPPRASPADYQVQAHAGNVTIVAEFTGHSIPAQDRTLSTEDYIVVETAFFGPPDSRLKLSFDDFSLRINGKKALLPCQPFIRAFESLKDPDWEPPSATQSKSKTSIGGGGKSDPGEGNLPPPPVHIPIEVRRAMEQDVRKAALPEGDRALPVAGLIFFQYRGKTQGIHSVELIYNGPAGSATLALQP
jgi:hypothetical protein